MKIVNTSRKFYITLELSEDELKQLQQEYQKIALEKSAISALLEQLLFAVR
ncbi:MAG: hypothetical protein H5U01_02855 [Clostridia bacterium]|nr:hypothetical protein [Clostridia bacterium]MBC7346039.1 hypothetical protein [Clostridia bacterium]